MNLKERFIYKASIGFSLGIFVDIIIKAICDSTVNPEKLFVNKKLVEMTGSYSIAIMLDLLLCGLLGLACNGGSVVYEIESWGALKATLVHFIFSISIYYIAGNFLGWFYPGINIANIIMVTIWILVYAMIWLIQYIVGKKEVEEMNKSIAAMKKREDNQ